MMQARLNRIENCCWTANRNDLALVTYYDKTGALPLDEKIFLRLTGEALSSVAETKDL